MKEFIWYEKYRAKRLSQLILPEDYRESFKNYIANKEIPHLLFHGPAGSGKTSIARILTKKCGNKDLTLNASSTDRGIKTVKIKVKNFAKSMPRGDRKNIMFFDEAHGLTNDAQEALNNTIERYQGNCRFIFTTNHISKIIPTIVSRCITFKFDTVDKEYMLKQCERILKKEGIKYKESDIIILVNKFLPDVRSLLNNLQACSMNGTLKPAKVLSMFDTKKLGDLIKKGELFKIRQTWKDQTDFTWFYDYLDREFVGGVKQTARGDVFTTMAEFIYRTNIVVDQEMNAAQCCAEIMSILEITVKL